MAKKIFSPPESFSMAPLAAILPVKSQVAKLEALSSFFYARFERVNAILGDAQDGKNEHGSRALQAERAMLQQILDWLDIKPSENGPSADSGVDDGS